MSLVPAEADFVGVDRILQGTDWARVVPMPQDMSAYDPALTPGALLRGALKTPDLMTVVASTELGTMVLSFDDVLSLRVQFTAAGTAGALPRKDLVWDVEAKNGLTGYIDRIAQGTAHLYREVTTASS